jgi:hypothetical protein
MDAVIIRKTRLPEGVAGITLKDENGDYNIYLNETCSADVQADAFRREIELIRNRLI